MTRALLIAVVALSVVACQQLPSKAERGPLCVECPVDLDPTIHEEPRPPSFWDVVMSGAVAVAIGHVLNAIVSR